MLKNKLYLQNVIIPIVRGFNNPEECKIKDIKLTSKVLKLKRFYKDEIEELQEQGKALNEKWIIPKTFELNEQGLYESGSKEDYKNFLLDNKELLTEEIKNCDIAFKLEDFEGSEIAHWIINLLDDGELLEVE